MAKITVIRFTKISGQVSYLPNNKPNMESLLIMNKRGADSNKGDIDIVTGEFGPDMIPKGEVTVDQHISKPVLSGMVNKLKIENESQKAEIDALNAKIAELSKQAVKESANADAKDDAKADPKPKPAAKKVEDFKG